MFVDASAIVAILSLEEGHETLAERLDQSRSSITSPLARFEAVLAIGRDQRLGLERARGIVSGFLEEAEVTTVPIDENIAEAALDAHTRYGKGRHPARLNFGDCFAYAMAKRHGVPLLYKGDDFAHTDLG